jgi:hypothetical protein
MYMNSCDVNVTLKWVSQQYICRKKYNKPASHLALRLSGWI